jgi:hypothetical protein
MPITEGIRIRAKVFPIQLHFRGGLRFLVLFLLSSSGTLFYAQTVTIKLVNGRDGHQMAATCVGVWVRQDRKDLVSIPTDKSGIAQLRLTDNDGEIDIHNRSKDCGLFGVINPVVKYDDTLRIDVGYALCLPRPDYSLLALTGISTKQLIQQGIVMPNSCGKATASTEPGKLIIFVRPFSWWERSMQ